MRQVTDLSVDRRKLDLPPDRPKKKAPQHLFERPAPVALPSGPSAARPPPQSSQSGSYNKAPEPPTAGMGSMLLNAGGRPQNGAPQEPPKVVPGPTLGTGQKGKLEKKGKGEEGEKEKKKKLGFFSSKKSKK